MYSYTVYVTGRISGADRFGKALRALNAQSTITKMNWFYALKKSLASLSVFACESQIIGAGMES